MSYKYRKNKTTNQNKIGFVRTSCARDKDARLYLRINSERKQRLEEYCQKLGVTTADFVDSLIGQALPYKPKPSSWRWEGDIEDMPLIP